MNDVRVYLPADQIEAARNTIADLLADLDLPSCFTIEEGSAQIADRVLFAGRDDPLDEVLFNNRVYLVSDAVVHRVARDLAGGVEPDAAFAQLVRDSVQHGVRLTRSIRFLRQPPSHGETFEDALDDAAARIVLRCSPETKQLLLSSPRQGAAGWAEQLSKAHDEIYLELGLGHRLPELVADASVPYPFLRVQINDLRCPIVKGLDHDEFMVHDTVDRLGLLNVTGERAINPADRTEWAVVRGRAMADVCEQAGITVLDAGGFALEVLKAQIRRHAGSLLPRSVADLNFKRLSTVFLATVKRAEEMFSLGERTRILRALLREGISIRNLRQVAESLVRLGPALDLDMSKVLVFTFPGFDGPRPALPSETQSLVEGTRSGLKRQICHAYTRGGSTLVVRLLAPEIEQQFMSGATASFLEAFRRAVWEELDGLPRWGLNKEIILTSANVRSRCVEALAADLPDLAVMSYQELVPDVSIQPISRIVLSES